MITKTTDIKMETEDWKITFSQGDEEVSFYNIDRYVGSMSLKDLVELVEFKKAIDDLA